uniref:Ig-like domain-containing protein n=1 Tax=Apteryx owenii TaxID=8824 RepID=A0A8B9NYM1_APTOW
LYAWEICAAASAGWALQQSPDAVIKEGGVVTLSCFQMGTTHAYMSWYKQAPRKGTMLQLVVFSVEGEKADFEEEFHNHFKSNGSKGYHLSFSIDFVSANDSVMCVSSSYIE